MIEYAEAQRQSDASPEGTSLPLSVQQALWWRFDEAYGSANCQASAQLEFRGRVDHEALRAAFERLLSRHAVLRTKIRLVGGRPTQRTVAAPAGVAFREHHLDGRWTAQRRCRLDARQPLSLKNGPLIRGSLMRLPDHAHVLQITLHQIVCDGESLNWLLRELLLLYRAGLTGNEDGVHDTTSTYRQCFVDDHLERAETRDEPMEQPSTNSPSASVPRADCKQTGTSASAGVPIAADLAIKLRRIAQEGLYAILVGAWISLLGRGLREADLIIGIETSNRSRLTQAPIIGPFANLVPMRIHVDKTTTVETLLQHVNRAVTLPGLSGPDPWRKVFEVRRRGGRARPVIPLALCACPPLNLGDLASIDVPGLTVERAWVDRHWPCAEISVCLEERGMNPMITLRCANDVMEPGAAQNMADRLLTLLDGVVTNRRGLELPLMNNY